MKHDAIAVIDFGGQYAHLIATKVRRHHVLAEIHQPEDSAQVFENYKGVILSGSPALGSQEDESGMAAAIFEVDIPILGLCFGHHEITMHYGGKIDYTGREWGHSDLHIVKEHPLFRGLRKVEQVWMSHNDSVVSLGPDFEELGYSILGKSGKEHRFAAIGSDKFRRYGVQFHPEVDDTPCGDVILGNFVKDICGCRSSWTMENYIDDQINQIRTQVGDESVFLLASGGVDSTVAAKLFSLALGSERVNLLHVDNGLMRKSESQKVLKLLTDLGMGKKLHFVDATHDFLEALKGEVQPEKKRVIIGNTFIEVFEREAARLGIQDHLLGQGTIYPDTIETGGTKRADVIKTHHNRVPMIEKMIEQGKVVEPLKDLYKVEVRELGEMLGIPKEAIGRHPFPGPGLGVRLLCAPVETGREIDLGEITQQVDVVANRYELQATVLPARSVGVKADVRSYEFPVMLTAGAHINWQTLEEASVRILKNVAGINRCVWSVSTDKPKQVKPIAATMTKKRLDLLRDADHMVMQGLKRHKIYDDIWQCPTVFIPLEIDGEGRELCVIRAIHSERAMTATAARLPGKLIEELKEAILALPGISGLAFDLTSKPPGTIEWE